MNNLSSEDAKCIAPFRLGSHFLEIEKGLHCVPKVPWKDRICKRCASDKVDDAIQIQVLQECSQFNNKRRNLRRGVSGNPIAMGILFYFF